jgi:hypothetical protein
MKCLTLQVEENDGKIGSYGVELPAVSLSKGEWNKPILLVHSYRRPLYQASDWRRRCEGLRQVLPGDVRKVSSTMLRIDPLKNE